MTTEWPVAIVAVFAKLGARDRTQAVIVAYESGFITP